MYANEYTCYKLYEQDIKPDTEFLWIQVDFDDTDPKFNTHGEKKLMSIIDWEKHENDNSKYFRFYAPAYTEDYANKADEAIDYYKEIKTNVDSIRADDDQYDDPALWDATERLELYQEKGLRSELFWQYNKI